jgi:protein involved in polysaccharide export with SLBB domain
MLFRLRRRSTALLVVGLLLPVAAEAQTTGPSTASVERRQFETREQLQARIQAAESAQRSGEAWLLKTRLERGDFQEGDRIVLSVPNLRLVGSDTITVRAGKLIQLPGMADFSLEGVLRSELTEQLTAHIGRYMREPTVRATQLLRVAVIGHVGRPGFYYSAADALLSDAIMAAGGPSANADLKNVTVRRGDDIIWQRADTRTAIAEGLSLDRLHLRAGDEIEIGGRRQFTWQMLIPMISSIAALVLTIAQIR